MTRRWLLVVLLVVGVATPSFAARTPALTLSVLSNTRADLVSDGQALVGVSVPSTSGLTVKVGSRDVTAAFRQADGRVEGLVDQLRVGTNVVTATRHGRRARLTITNHPNGGPIFGGPQLQPWRCPEGARDKQCNRPPTFSYLYKSTDPRRAGLSFYDPGP
jgi:hypothetical protein